MLSYYTVREICRELNSVVILVLHAKLLDRFRRFIKFLVFFFSKMLMATVPASMLTFETLKAVQDHPFKNQKKNPFRTIEP